MESLKELYKIGFGPSSSHTIGPFKAAKLFIERFPAADHYKVILYASLALTGKGHLTDEIIRRVFQNSKLEIVFDETSKVKHPNTMDFYAYKDGSETGMLRIISVGGGSIKVEGEKWLKPKNYYPFQSFEEIKNYALNHHKTLAQIVFEFDEHDIKQYLAEIWSLMQSTIEIGITKDGILPGSLKVHRKAKRLFNVSVEDSPAEVLERKLISAYAYAVAEENASGGVIVTAPTCGASGVLPSVLYYLQKKYNFSEAKIIDALAVGGLIGNLIKTNASISGAEAGCQAEIGSACAMSAAAVASLFKMDINQIECAAEIGLEHNLGLTCDPIQGYVQIPCIERNAVASLRALDAVNLAYFLEDTRKISFDMVVKTMYETGKDINSRYRETSKGGLAKNYKVS